ncbi:MAG: hypothetical protein RO009_10105 [Pseudorhodoplanes sp.]|nr:hypothetical protein [Pseudorhodoplanes sp.]
MTAALTELHRAGRIADTLRFHRYPAAVLIGRHQNLGQAVHVGRCRAAGIELARRVTGGGAVYMAPGALAWDLVIGRDTVGSRLNHAAAAVGEAVAAALARLGLPARYRAENEIEIAGRKICGMSGYFDGGTLVYQGTILTDASLSNMSRFLKLPLKRTQSLRHDLRERLATVTEILGRNPDPGEIENAIEAELAHALGRSSIRRDLTVEERELAEEWHRTEFGLESFVSGCDLPSEEMTMIGRDGCVHAYIKLIPGSERLIDQIWLTGNFSVSPSRTIPDLEAALRGMPVQHASERTVEILSSRQIEMRGASCCDLAAAIAKAAVGGCGRRTKSL